jgi:hypothetical protein
MSNVTYIFSVRGRGAFPIDMLRYDQATPVSSGDASLIEQTFQPRNRSHDIIVQLRTALHAPTVGRWESFGWKVERPDA